PLRPAIEGRRLRCPSLPVRLPIAVGFFDVGLYVSAEQFFVLHIFADVELPLVDYEIVRIDVAQLASSHSPCAEASVLRYVFLWVPVKLSLIQRGFEKVGCVSVSDRILRIPFHRLAFRKISHWIIAL